MLRSYLFFFYSFPFLRTPRSYTNGRLVLALPELLQLIGRHIQRSDLLSCIRVCRAWNEILTPELWRTVDTPCRPWSKVCNESRLLTGPREEIEQWFRTEFEQHGHHIRNLKGPWNSAFEAAFLTENCRNLDSLHVTFVAYHAIMDASVRPSEQYISGPTTSNKDLMDRYVVGRFWSLVQRNPGMIGLSVPILDTMNALSKENVLNTFRKMRKLKELNMRMMTLDAQGIFEAIPQLERLSGDNLHGLFSLQKDFCDLRFLSWRGRDIVVSGLLLMLKHLPGLETLHVQKVIEETSYTYSTLAEMVTASPRYPQLKVLAFLVNSPVENKFTVLLIGLFPKLVHFYSFYLCKEIVGALWEHCYYLESICGKGDKGFRERRANDARGKIVGVKEDKARNK